MLAITNMLMNLKAGPKTPAITDGSITKWTDFGAGGFPDFEDTDDPRNVRLLSIQPPMVPASSRVFCWTAENLHSVQS